ncbi:MAG: tRNA dihydrouridine synthase DusB [Spirochaetales bacterium]|nr:tRNA dihydrouridine synthase DusB [Spirochaetales bacterium]
MKNRCSHESLNHTTANNFLKQITLKNSVLPGNLFLAPLAGYTDAAFRSICLDYGADFTYTEMVSAEALARKNQKTLSLLERAENETLLGVQLFASEYSTCLKALPQIRKYKPTLIDLNCGCSVPKVLKTGSGAALLQTPVKIQEIVKALSQASSIPVTLKLRSGWDETSINFLEIACQAEEAGAALITLHPRTRAQRFAGLARWEQISALKKHIAIPVIGSGDLFSAEHALCMIEQTGCDGVMFARGAIGNPFIFRLTKQLAGAENTTETIPPQQRLFTALIHLKRLAELKGEHIACREMRKHMAAYTKGLKNSKVLRELCNKAQTLDEYAAHINVYKKKNL